MCKFGRELYFHWESSKEDSLNKVKKYDSSFKIINKDTPKHYEQFYHDDFFSTIH